MNIYPMTPEGHNQLKQELDRLIKQERPKIINDIAFAREKGDLKENAEYHAAKDAQGLLEAKIRLIEQKLASAQVIDTSKMENDGRVIFGVEVTITNLESERQIKYRIVGEDQADLSKNMISSSSPIAQGLLGKYEGETTTIVTPEGANEFSIDEVIY